MKASTIIRFILATLLVTLACIGLLYNINMAGLFGLGWLLLNPSELTRPIPRGERWKAVLFTAIFVAALLTLPFLRLDQLPAPRLPFRIIGAALMWLGWLWIIYQRWRREKQQRTAVTAS